MTPGDSVTGNFRKDDRTRRLAWPQPNYPLVLPLGEITAGAERILPKLQVNKVTALLQDELYITCPLLQMVL